MCEVALFGTVKNVTTLNSIADIDNDSFVSTIEFDLEVSKITCIEEENNFDDVKIVRCTAYGFNAHLIDSRFNEDNSFKFMPIFLTGDIQLPVMNKRLKKMKFKPAMRLEVDNLSMLDSLDYDLLNESEFEDDYEEESCNEVEVSEQSNEKFNIALGEYLAYVVSSYM